MISCFINIECLGDKIYGILGRITGNPEQIIGTEEYPIFGFYKENFYTLKKNGVLKESDSKPTFYNNGITETEGVTLEDINMFQYDKNSDLYYFNYKNGEKYTCIGADESSIADIVYSVELKNSEAKFVEEDNIDIKWLDDLNQKDITVNENEEIRVLKYFAKGNKVILGKRVNKDEEVYLGEITNYFLYIQRMSRFATPFVNP